MKEEVVKIATAIGLENTSVPFLRLLLIVQSDLISEGSRVFREAAVGRQETDRIGKLRRPVSGGPSGTRTLNQRIKSPLLYQLS